MSDKRHQRDPKRVFPTWLHALYLAVSYGFQTGFKYRVYRAGSVWRIQRTERRFVDDGFHRATEYVQRWDRADAATGRPRRGT